MTKSADDIILHPKGSKMSDDSASKRLLQALGEQDRIAKALSDAALPDSIRTLQKLGGPDSSLKGLTLGMSSEQLKQIGNALSGGPHAELQAQLNRMFVGLAAGSTLSGNLDKVKQTLTGVIPARPAAVLRSERVRTAADIGALVRRARKAMKMNQAQFAAHVGVGRRFVSELEGGKASLEFDRVMACAEAAGVDLVARVRGG